MSKGQEFDLEVAKREAELLVKCFSQDGIFHKVEIVGSIRRNKKKVHDIDLIGLRAIDFENKILEGNWNGIPFQIYLADEGTYDVIKCMRTGSAEFNKKLCMLAKQKGWKYEVSGRGLVDKHGKIIDNTEQGILEKLLGKYIEPEYRD